MRDNFSCCSCRLKKDNIDVFIIEPLFKIDPWWQKDLNLRSLCLECYAKIHAVEGAEDIASTILAGIERRSAKPKQKKKNRSGKWWNKKMDPRDESRRRNKIIKSFKD